MKGFIFSLEAIASISIVILACTIFFYATTNQPDTTNLLKIRNQSNQATTIYFNLPPQEANPLANTQTCGKIIAYKKLTRDIEDKNVCEELK